MNRSNKIKVISRFLGILVCLALVQAACALPDGSQRNQISESVVYGNGTYENNTYETESVNEDEPEESATAHTINPTSHYTYLLAGNNEKFTVSFKNEGNEALTIAPEVVPLISNGNGIVEEWITISPAEATVEAGAVQEFTVEVAVPRDAETGSYQTAIPFTDDLVPNSEDYLNSMKLDISVQALPKIELQTTYISDTVKAGEEYEYRIKIKNVADKDVTINPELTGYTYDISSNTLGIGDDSVVISAPSVIEAGGIANMTIKVPVPEGGTGSYSGYIDMNVDGKTGDGSNPQLGLYLRSIQEPTVPYVKTFSTTNNAPLTIEVSTNMYDQTMGLRVSPKIEEPSFKVKMKCNSRSVRMSPTKLVQNNNVNIGASSFPAWSLDDSTNYQDTSKYYVETYTVPGAVGKWELSIMPKNAENFGYSITFGKLK
jgi:hypothetical protein